jgi:hypothetical protein
MVTGATMYFKYIVTFKIQLEDIKPPYDHPKIPILALST